jgi:hypothetical protein
MVVWVSPAHEFPFRSPIILDKHLLYIQHDAMFMGISCSPNSCGGMVPSHLVHSGGGRHWRVDVVHISSYWLGFRLWH